MPVGVRVGRVGAAGARSCERVAGLRRRRPRAGDAVVAVDDEVDRQPLGVPVAHRVGADARRASPRELQLDVVVGELAGPEAGEAVAAEDDPDHPRRQPLDALDDSNH